MAISNPTLLGFLTDQAMKNMGFVKDDDGSGDPRGISWILKNEKFHILIDAWGLVKLSRLNPDSDSITVECDTIYDLEEVVNFIQD